MENIKAIIYTVNGNFNFFASTKDGIAQKVGRSCGYKVVQTCVEDQGSLMSSPCADPHCADRMRSERAHTVSTMREDSGAAVSDGTLH